VRVAAQEFDAGRRAFQLEDYASAADHFENAHRDVPSPEALRLAIRAHDLAGNAERAATLAALALRAYPDDSGTVALAQEYLKKLEPGLHRLTIACKPACSVVVDKRSVLEDPVSEGVVFVPAGPHVVVAVWSGGREHSERVVGQAGVSTSLSFRAPPPSTKTKGTAESSTTSPHEEPPASSGLPPVLTYVGLGLTTVLAGATIWSGIDTKNNPGRDVVEERCLDLGENCPEYQQGLDSQRRTNLLLGVTAGGAVLTGVVALFTDWGREAPTSTGTVLTPAVLAGGAGLSATGRF
jgi:hypothetical protein